MKRARIPRIPRIVCLVCVAASPAAAADLLDVFAQVQQKAAAVSAAPLRPLSGPVVLAISVPAALAPLGSGKGVGAAPIAGVAVAASRPASTIPPESTRKESVRGDLISLAGAHLEALFDGIAFDSDRR